jgi:hypothetical protein
MQMKWDYQDKVGRIGSNELGLASWAGLFGQRDGEVEQGNHELKITIS